MEYVLWLLLLFIFTLLIGILHPFLEWEEGCFLYL